MGIFDKLSSVFERKLTDVSNYTWSELFPGHVKSGVAVNVWTSLRVTTVLACARVLAEGIAQMPLFLYDIDVAKNTKTKNITHPAYHLLANEPNEWMTAFELREMMTIHAVLTGNAYAYLGWAGVGPTRKLIEIIPLMPQQVSVIRQSDYSLKYFVTDITGKTTEVDQENILHIRGPSWDGYLGMDAVQMARDAIGLAIATEETHASLHANGAQPGGVLSVKGKLDAAARARLKEQWQNFQGGVANRFKTAVLDVDASWAPLAMTGVDSQHLETRRFQIEEVCRALRVFPQLVMHTEKTSTFASADAFFLAHVTHSLMPWIIRWEQAINRVIIGNDNTLVCKLNVASLLRGDAAQRADFYMKALGGARGETAYMTRNEVRELEDLNPIEGGDKLMIPPPPPDPTLTPPGVGSKANPNHGPDGRFASAANSAGAAIHSVLASAGGAAAIAGRAILKHVIASGAAKILVRYAIVQFGIPAIAAIAADIALEAIFAHVTKSDDAINNALDKLSAEDLQRLANELVDRLTPDEVAQLTDALSGCKMNPNHDDHGRFASSPGIHASGPEAALLKKKEWISKSKLKTVDDVYRAADANKALLDAAGARTASETQTVYKAAPIKKIDRVLQKITTEGRAPNAVNDIVRSSVFVNSPAEADKVVASLAKQLPITDEGFGAKNTGYFDRALNVRFPNGQLGEVLIMSPEIAHAKNNGGHDLYEGERNLPKGHPLKEVLVNASQSHYQMAHDAMNTHWNPTLSALGLKRSGG